MRTALVDHQELARRAALSGHIRRTGALHVFDSLAGLRHALAEWKERQAHGVAFREVSPDEARALAPALAGPFAAAILAPEYWVVSSPAAVLAALRRRLRQVVPERVIEIRADTSEVALLTDGRFSGATRGLMAGHVGPEAQMGGPITALRDGDIVVLDAEAGRLDVELDDAELRRRLADWTPPATQYPGGALYKYAQLVGPASEGAVTHPGLPA